VPPPLRWRGGRGTSPKARPPRNFPPHLRGPGISVVVYSHFFRCLPDVHGFMGSDGRGAIRRAHLFPSSFSSADSNRRIFFVRTRQQQHRITRGLAPRRTSPGTNLVRLVRRGPPFLSFFSRPVRSPPPRLGSRTEPESPRARRRAPCSSLLRPALGGGSNPRPAGAPGPLPARAAAPHVLDRRFARSSGSPPPGPQGVRGELARAPRGAGGWAPARRGRHRRGEAPGSGPGSPPPRRREVGRA